MSLPVNIPAFATSVLVEAISWEDGLGNLPASFGWVAATLSVPRCGDGILDTGETCDGSAGSCPTGSTCQSDCTCSPVCGDNHVDSGETCDGTDASVCNTGQSCRAATTTDECTCCGDGIKQGSEECETNADCATGSHCRDDCTCAPGLVPTMTEWGMVALLLVLLAGVTFKIRRLVIVGA